MTVFRLSKAKYARDLSGSGARIAGGRWNSKGIPVLYTSSSRALALAEFLVHIPQVFSPGELCIVSLRLPPGVKIPATDEEDLPGQWRAFSFSAATRRIGDSWAKLAAHSILKVPSAVVDEEFNYLVNPFHRQAEKIKILDIRPFDLDERLLRKDESMLKGING